MTERGLQRTASYASTDDESNASEDRVRVCVRIRPLAPKEAAKGATISCRADGSEVVLDEGKRYAYDCVFGDKSCDEANAQDDVWRELAPTLAPAAKEGYNVSLLAYGQTGSGKSHTMFGRKSCRGVVPRFCEALFEEGEQGLSVAASMLEIYNEKLRDLLVTSSESLRIREDPQTGPYAAGATVVKCASAQDLLRLVRLGARNRTIASTRMNETSSRAHTVFTVRLVRDSVEDGYSLRRSACVHLVDLAGSERQKRAGSTGTRLKEAGHINRSLSTLSAVVNALTKKDGRHVPYRDSTLTHLLRDSLGGNARTTMVATVSPSVDDGNETHSTLRYAERCKKVACRPVINETELSKRDSIIRKMAEEIRLLREELAAEREKKTVRPQGFSTSEPLEDDSSPGKALTMARQRMEQDALQRITDYESSMSTLSEWAPAGCESLTTVDQLERASFGTASRGGLATRKSSREARLVNLNEDPQLSGALRYSLKEGASVIGAGRCDVQLGGTGVAEEHSVINVVNDDIVVHKRQGDTYVNGREVTEPIKLKHGDRVAFGRLNVFRLSLLGQDDDGEGDWDAAVAELAAHASSTSGLDLPLDDDASSSTRSRQPSLESLDSAVSGRSRPSSCELSPVVESPARAAAKVSFDDYDALGDAGARHRAAARLQARSRGRAVRRRRRKAPRPVITSPVARVSPPKVFSPLEAEVAELRSRLDAIEGRDRPPASPVVAPVAPAASPAAKAALEKRLRGAPAAPRGLAFGNAAARAPGTPPKDEAARERRSVFAKASPGAPAKEAPSPFLEYHNKKSISPGAPAAPEAVPEKPRQRPPPRPPLADATRTLDPHAPRAELRAALRKLRPLAAAAAAAWGGAWAPVLEPCVADDAALRCLPSVARDNGRSVDQSLLQWALNRDEEPMRGAGRIGVAGVHLEALAKGFDVRGSVAVADRSGNTACTLAVALRARPRGGVKVGNRVSIDVAMAVTDGLDDVDSGLRRSLVYQFFDRPPTVVVAEGPLRHAASLELDVTPALFSYLSAEALLVEVRLVDEASVAAATG